ncbi:cytochrome c [bacterium]|nr:cytochrome c [bacterium]
MTLGISIRLPSLLLVLFLPSFSCTPSPDSDQPLSTPGEDISRSFTHALDLTPASGMSASERSGRRQFEYYCGNCHGTQGRGDGFNAFNLDIPPADLAVNVTPETYTDENLAAFISAGGKASDRSALMPPWGLTLSTRQINDIVSYLRYQHRHLQMGDEGDDAQ